METIFLNPYNTEYGVRRREKTYSVTELLTSQDND